MGKQARSPRTLPRPLMSPSGFRAGRALGGEGPAAAHSAPRSKLPRPRWATGGRWPWRAVLRADGSLWAPGRCTWRRRRSRLGPVTSPFLGLFGWSPGTICGQLPGAEAWAGWPRESLPSFSDRGLQSGLRLRSRGGWSGALAAGLAAWVPPELRAPSRPGLAYLVTGPRAVGGSACLGLLSRRVPRFIPRGALLTKPRVQASTRNHPAGVHGPLLTTASARTLSASRRRAPPAPTARARGTHRRQPLWAAAPSA